ncbi:S9 family peptidase [Lewinella sp. IMCC34183]|uniref:S9 family peptidase n=1 Tax=Lewinella sp. IMCC34183 TaxID=2248762 RepID=UPI000E22CDCB|nr:DPP IV N-terminal domain-containing protein [Lewinella sp. IMCC34183]
MRLNHPTATVLLLLLCSSLPGQDTIGRADYQRAIEYLYENYGDDKLFNAHVSPHWLPDSSGLWYVLRDPGGETYRSYSFAAGTTAPLFDPERLAAALRDSLDTPVDARRLPIADLRYLGPDTLSLTAAGRRYLLGRTDYSLTRAPAYRWRGNREEAPAPDGSYVAFTRDQNLYLRTAATGEERALTTDGERGYEYASWYGWDDIIEGEGGERPAHFGVDWSEDGKWISTSVVDLRRAQKMYLLDWSVDSLYRPKLLSYYRGSPGDTGMVYVEPVFFEARTGRTVRPNLPRGTHINALGVRWSQAPGQVYLQEQRRGFKDIALYRFDLNSERLDTLYTEHSPTNIDNFGYVAAEKAGSVFFFSERSGWRQLYRIDLATDAVTPVTQGEFYVTGIEHVNAAERTLYFTATGREPGRNPYFQHLYRVGFDGSDLTLLTPENRHHHVDIAPGGRYFLDNYSTLSEPTVTVVRRTSDGSVVQELSRADLRVPAGWSPPETFSTLAGDGKTTLYGAVWKPINFDSTRRYPVLESSYTGPHTHVFPEDFGSVLSMQSFAELGFVVVRIDGRGSSGRSKAFHDYSYKNLGGGLADHITVMREMGRRHAWFDTTRVGVFGHSAGGYDAGHAVLAYPDFYKVAVASSADHDHRMEKAWWPEMYMGWPVDSVYEQQSNITLAGNLRGKLLVTHGGIDENVNPSATFKLAEALIRADRPFDMLILPSQRHGYRGQANRYFTKVRWNYFLEHLRGVEPLWDIGWED